MPDSPINAKHAFFTLLTHKILPRSVLAAYGLCLLAQAFTSGSTVLTVCIGCPVLSSHLHNTPFFHPQERSPAAQMQVLQTSFRPQRQLPEAREDAHEAVSL